LIGIIAAAVLFAFMIVYVIVFWYALGDNTEASAQTLNDSELLAVSTGLTGLVGGIVAVALGQQGNEASANASNNGRTWRNRLAILYTLVYTVLGLGAAVVWVIIAARGDTAPDIVKALASVALGLFIPIVRTYFIPGATEGQELTSGTSLTIVSVTPPRDVEDVLPDTPVTVTFSTDVEPASIKGTNHFTLVRVDTERTAHTPVIGDVDYGQPGNPPRVAAFAPANELENGRTYQATITKGVRDLRGNTLAEDYTWQFKVKPREGSS